MSKKILVAYFSAGGATASAARAVAFAAGGELYEIKPAVPYTAADLDWNDSRSRSSMEMNDEACRPAIAGELPDLGQYDAVFLGFPIWWYVEPRIVDTFLEAYDLSGKTIVPFATSGGSGLGKAPQRMAELAPGATVLEGRLLNGNPSASELCAWTERLTVC